MLSFIVVWVTRANSERSEESRF